MIEIPTAKWRFLGDTANSKNYEIEPHVMAGVPNPGTRDDAVTARDNVAFQNELLKEWGGGVVLVFFDNVVAQDKDARRIYQMEPEQPHFRACGLVGGTLLSRAVMSFFVGLTKPRVPIKVFGSLADALQWARAINGAAMATAQENVAR
jgi:hypothetical protein